MSKLRDVFCVYEYDAPNSKTSNQIYKEKPSIDSMLDNIKQSLEELEERWIDSRSLSQNSSSMQNQHRNRSVNSQMEGSTRYSKNT